MSLDCLHSVLLRIATVVILVPSFVYDDGLLFCVKESGVATCLDARTGQAMWTQRLGGRP